MSNLFPGKLRDWGGTLPQIPKPNLTALAARDHALRRLFDYLAEVEWSYGKSNDEVKRFKISRQSMFPEQPDKAVEIDFPAIGVIPSKHSFADQWLGSPRVLDETRDKYGYGTALVHYAEFREDVTLDVFTQYSAQRRSIIAGCEGEVFHPECGPLMLALPAYYDRVASFSFEGTTRFDGDSSFKNQREVHIHLELRVDAVFLITGQTLNPHAFLNVDDD